MDDLDQEYITVYRLYLDYMSAGALGRLANDACTLKKRYKERNN